MGQNQLSLDEVTSAIKKLGSDVTAISHPLFNDSIRVEVLFDIKPSEATDAYLARIEPIRGNGTTLDPIYIRAQANDKSILPSTSPHSKEYPLAQLLASNGLHVNAIGLKPKLTFGVSGNCPAVSSYPEDDYIGYIEWLHFVCHVVNPEYNSFRTDVASFLDLIGQKLCVNFDWPATLPRRRTCTTNDYKRRVVSLWGPKAIARRRLLLTYHREKRHQPPP